MLLQEIVDTLDAELDRLYRLRTIVSGISGSLKLESIALEALPEQIEAEELHGEVEAAPPTPPAGSPRATRDRRPVKAKISQATADATPLKGTIPAKPVLVSAAALAKERALKITQEAEIRKTKSIPPSGSLGSMIRALHLDRQN